MTIDSVTMINNQATGSGGAVATVNNQIEESRPSGASLATVTITKSTFADNLASSGGAIYNGNGNNFSLTNDTLNGNSASDGGAIYNDGSLSVSFTTIAGNSADSGNGGGIYNGNYATLGASIVATNTATGRGPDLNGRFVSLGYNLIGDGFSATGLIDSDQVGYTESPIDPLLSALANNGGPRKRWRCCLAVQRLTMYQRVYAAA